MTILPNTVRAGAERLLWFDAGVIVEDALVRWRVPRDLLTLQVVAEAVREWGLGGGSLVVVTHSIVFVEWALTRCARCVVQVHLFGSGDRCVLSAASNFVVVVDLRSLLRI